MGADEQQTALLRVGALEVAAAPGELVLDACLRAGHALGHSCRAGACRACLVRAVGGQPPPQAQQGLSAAQVANGWFLACQAVLQSPLAITLDGAGGARAKVRLARLDWLAPAVLRVRLDLLEPFAHSAGQSLQLLRADGVLRSYSIASVPQLDPQLELHVRVLPGGVLSGWLARAARVGDLLEVRGPAGDCSYVPQAPDEALLLAGTGTGLAPLFGVVRDALACGHRGRIELYHGALDAAGLYLVDALRQLAAEHGNLRYHPSVLRGPAPPGVELGALGECLARDFQELAGWRVYLCGAPELVQALRRQCFLDGASLERIHSDSFAPAAKATPVPCS